MKLLSDTTMSDEDVLKVVNNALNSDYPTLNTVPLEKLYRVYMLLEIAFLCKKHNISIFQHKETDDTPNP